MPPAPDPDFGHIITVHACRSIVALLAGGVLTVVGAGLGIGYLFARDIVFLGAAAMALPSGLMFLFWAKVLSGRRAVVYENGLGLRRGAEEHLIPWYEIKRVDVESTPIQGGTVNTYYVITRSGDRHQIDDQYQDIATLIYSIQSGLVASGSFNNRD